MAKVGGRRSGAGRKPGSANKKTREIADAAVAAGLTPLDFMLAVLRDENADVKRRDDMAKAAAPYMHPRLTAVEPTPLAAPAPRAVTFEIVLVPGRGQADSEAEANALLLSENPTRDQRSEESV